MKPASDARIKSFLKKIAGADDLEQVVGKATHGFQRGGPGVEAAGGPEAAARSASEVVRKLAANIPLNDQERFQYEAIVIPDLRPAVRIAGGDYEVGHAAWLHLNAADRKAALRPTFPSIGRIELPNHPNLPYGGTGFVVGDGLLMTNRHVAEIFASGVGRAGLAFHSELKAGIDFRKEEETDPPDYLELTGIALIHPYWDMALLRVEGLGAHRKPLPLALSHPAELEGREAAVVGYPAFDPRNPASVQDRVFEGVYNVKRLQPGVIRAVRPVESYSRRVEAMTHDSSTLGGNSGSAIIDILNGQILGLHFGGRYLDANFGVPAYELGRDARVVDTGVRFAGVAAPGPGAADSAWELIETTAGGTQPAVGPGAATPDGATSARAQATFELPIRITIEAGAPVKVEPSVGVVSGAATVIPSVSVAAIERMVEPIHDRNYPTRHGYDPNFLGIRVPFPQPRDTAVAASMKSGGIEIPYHHFSVIMHEKRRLALVTGANVDAHPARKRPEARPDKDYQRDGLGGIGENDQERWFVDDRLRADQQLPDKFFTRDRKSFDKGHLVRREDVAWGDSYEEVRFANGDTFHVTNCSPQVAGFNRASGRNWGGLENQVLGQAATEKLCVFSAPVLSDQDQNFRGVDDDGYLWVPIPSQYWKVIVAERDGAIESYGFVLEQDLDGVDWEYAVAPEWVPLMRPIAEIETMAGIDFPEVVRRGDQARTAHGEAVRRSMGVGVSSAATGQGRTDAEPIAGLLDDLSPIIDGWRAQQANGATAGDVRMTLNFSDSAPDDAAVAASLREALRLDLEVGPLFEADAELDRFRRLTIRAVSRIDRQDMFDLARAVRGISGAASVDPDLGTDYYDYDPPSRDRGPGGAPAGPESANLTFWCWADDEDKPADPDWAIGSTRVPEAWAYSMLKNRPEKGRDIRVFQPDTGVVADHGELGKDIHKRPGAANFVERNQAALDPMTGGRNPGHGTGTGSVVVSDEGGAMRGVAPLASLVPVRCIETVAVFDQSPVAQAIDHARNNGAHVISMSLGGLFSDALQAAVRKAVKANIIVIAAAGNCVGEVVWPARYPETIAVGGVNAAWKPWRGSSSGGSVAISGPAEFVLRADPRQQANPNAVSGGQGTSFATAHLAGVAALWLAHHGRDALIAGLPAGRTLQDMFRAVIRASAKIPPGFDTSRYGAGIVNAEAALKRDPFAALAAAAQPSRSGVLDQLTSLLDGVFGGGAAETAAPALADRQNYPELAAAAFERLRAGRSQRAAREAMPPTGLSVGLRTVLGGDAHAFTKVEASDEH